MHPTCFFFADSCLGPRRTAILHLSTAEVKDIDLLALGTKHLDMETPFESAVPLRDHLIELIWVRNLRHRPEALFALFRQFLQRLAQVVPFLGPRAAATYSSTWMVFRLGIACFCCFG